MIVGFFSQIMECLQCPTKWVVRLLLAMSCMTLLLSSCSMQSIDEEPESANPYVMTFLVNAGAGESTNPSGSRASRMSDDGFLEGVDFENTIDLTDLHVYLFDTDNKLIVWVTDPDLAKVSDFSISPVLHGDEDSGLYRIRFRVDRILKDVEILPQSFKILMLANWRDYPDAGHLKRGVTTITDITSGKDYAEDRNPSIGLFDNSSPTFIPFFGVQEYNDVTFHPGENEKSQLLLLRAYAKIDVCDHSSSVSKVKRVLLHRYNDHFFKAPLGIDSSEDYTSVSSPGNVYVSSLSLPSDNKWENDNCVSFSKKADGHFVAFVPEYKNVARDNNEKRCWLDVEFEDGETYRVDFKYYNDPLDGASIGDPFDLRRNYWYRFELNRREKELILSFKNLKWTYSKAVFDL